ncbi:type II toxin-antitoxin system VapC family toxin [Rhizobium johnstonii]|uniref:type II toxin-antitoxin system VapC family toxin n=1 Tax=Rhizobium johnstonii TaxID=3019933 RepID=UPI003F9B6377
MTTFLDSSILISLMKSTEANHQWALNEFNTRILNGPIVISDVVYSEVSVSFPNVAEVDEALSELGVERHPRNDEALFTAGRAYQTYRKKNKGPKLGVLPDFFIGAAAHQENAPLLTDNKRDFTNYFPSLVLVVPP